jgi:hypothetical protein
MRSVSTRCPAFTSAKVTIAISRSTAAGKADAKPFGAGQRTSRRLKAASDTASRVRLLISDFTSCPRGERLGTSTSRPRRGVSRSRQREMSGAAKSKPFSIDSY